MHCNCHKFNFIYTIKSLIYGSNLMLSVLTLTLCIAYASSLRLTGANGKVLGGPTSKTATFAQQASGFGWDSHKAVDSIPESLVRDIGGNKGMRAKFEKLCRTAQVTYSPCFLMLVQGINDGDCINRLIFAKLLKISTAKGSSVLMPGPGKVEAVESAECSPKEECLRKLV